MARCSVEIPASASKGPCEKSSSGADRRTNALGNSGMLQAWRARTQIGAPGAAPSSTTLHRKPDVDSAPPPGFHFYTVRHDDRTSEDVGEHALGNRDAGPWITRYNKKRGTDLKPGDRLLVPDVLPPQAEILLAKRLAYEEEAGIVWQRWVRNCDTDECKRIRALKAEIAREYPGTEGAVEASLQRPHVPMTNEGEIKAAFQQHAAMNRDVLHKLNMTAAGPDGPVLMRGPASGEYRLTPQAREFLRGVFREFGIEYFPDDLPIRMKQLEKVTVAQWDGERIWINSVLWTTDAVGEYAYQLAVLGHEIMHAIQGHLMPDDHGDRAALEAEIVKANRYRLTRRLVERAQMDPNAPGFKPLDPNDPTALLEQLGMMVYYRIMTKFGPGAIDAMPLGLRPAHPRWLPQ